MVRKSISTRRKSCKNDQNITNDKLEKAIFVSFQQENYDRFTKILSAWEHQDKEDSWKRLAVLLYYFPQENQTRG